MALTPGTRVGPYEILAPLGAGGMGEVYRARDSRLKREVALKLLLEAVAQDPDRVARFQREAEALAALNHPHIAAIYGTEGNALVLELVEGPTLAERLSAGPIPLDEALPLIQQIIDALEYAHEKGIVHRDLKPANIKLTPSGSVKLLDFGLAKALASEPAAGDPSSSPTLTMRATVAGVILGTAGYMAPEQARGKSVDKRADIWAFGAVVYEIVTGRMLFQGETVTDTLAQVLTREPDFGALPPRVRGLVRRCLERDVRQRLRDIGDARMLLEDGAEPTPAAPANRGVVIALAGAACVFGLSAAGLAFVHFRERPEPQPVVRFDIPLPDRINTLSVAPDGGHLAVEVPLQGNQAQILIRSLDSPEVRTIAAGESVSPGLAWTPDSRFLICASGKLRKFDVSTGAGQVLSDLSTDVFPPTLAVAPNGAMYLYGPTGFQRFPASGGSPSEIAAPNATIRFLQISPDARHFLFSAGGNGLVGGTFGIFPGSLDDLRELPKWAAAKPLLTTDSARFLVVPSADSGRGYLLFTRDQNLVAQEITFPQLTPAGASISLAEGVSAFGASAAVLAYRLGGRSQNARLRWLDRHGKELATLGDEGALQNVGLSRDGKTVVYDRLDSGVGHVWMGDAARGAFTRLTSANGSEAAGHVAPDGSVVFTSSAGGGAGDLFILRPNSSQPEALWKSPHVMHTNDISPDGKYLIFDEHGPQRQDLYVLPLDGPEGRRKPIPFVVTAADESMAQFSPDGKWVVYYSDESGRPEIFVRQFLPDKNPAAGGRKYPVSTGGGNKPRWGRDGKEIYYLSPDRHMMAVAVKTGESFEAGMPMELFAMPPASGYVPFDVAPDGRFLVDAQVAQQASPEPLHVVLNWAAAFRQ